MSPVGVAQRYFLYSTGVLLHALFSDGIHCHHSPFHEYQHSHPEAHGTISVIITFFALF